MRGVFTIILAGRRFCVSAYRITGRLARITLAVAIAVLFAHGWAMGGEGGKIILPATKSGLTSSVSLTLDTSWASGEGGYRPVRITATSANNVAFSSTRTLRIEIGRRDMGYLSTHVDLATGLLELPQGATQATTTILLPQTFSDYPEWSVQTWENGRKLNELSGDRWRSGTSNQVTGDTNAILYIHGKVPSRDKLDKFLGSRSTLNSKQLPDFVNLGNSLGLTDMKGQVFSDDQATLTYIEQTLQLMALNPVDVPTEWLGLSGLDYIAIPADDAIAMAAQQREGWEAIVAWIHAGGKLVIYRAFEGNEQVQQLRQILDPSRVQGEAPNSESHPKGIFGHLGFGAYCVTLRDGGPIDDESEHDAKQDIQTFFGARNLSDFNVRHGLTLSGSNPGFWNFVIAGVGLPPSGAFLVLISLFVIVLGPVNYFALARRQRLYLLLLTVPLGAGLATLGLFSYALLSDGLGARARVRDFTILDQTTGYAATMSRQAVFAGLAPSGGPTIPRDLAIYPIFPDGRERKRALRIDWSDQKQRLTGGYLSSRSMSQFFFVRSHRTESRLPIQIAADRLSGSAENRLGVKLRDVWAQDAEGNLYAGENGEPGETCILKPVARSVAHGRFLKSWALQNMAPGDDTSRYWSSRSSGWNQRANRPGNQGAGDASASLLERRLLFLQQNFTLPSSATVIDDSGETATNGQIRSDGAREGKWFLAVAESSRETPVLIESAVVADRLHVIEGNW